MATERLILEVRTTGTRRVQRDIQGIAKSAKAANQTMALLRSTLVLVAGARVISRFIKLADSLTNIQTRLKLVTNSTEELNAVQGKLFEVAQDTRSSFTETANLFNRLAASSKGLGLSYNDLADVTTTVNQAVILSGVSAGTAANGLQQFAQGLGQGVLRGDELRSVVENLPGLADIIAENFEVAGETIGLTRGELIAFAKANEGVLETEKLIKALQKAAAGTGETFKKVGFTVDQAFTRFETRLIVFIGQLGQSVAIGESLDKLLQTIADHFGEILVAAAALGTIAVFNLLTSQLVRLGSTGVGVFGFLFGGFTNLAQAVSFVSLQTFGLFQVLATGATKQTGLLIRLGATIHSAVVLTALRAQLAWLSLTTAFTSARTAVLSFAAANGVVSASTLATTVVVKAWAAAVVLVKRAYAATVAFAIARMTALRVATIGVTTATTVMSGAMAAMGLVSSGAFKLMRLGILGAWRALIGLIGTALAAVSPFALIAVGIALIVGGVIALISKFVDLGAVLNIVLGVIEGFTIAVINTIGFIPAALKGAFLGAVNGILRLVGFFVNKIRGLVDFAIGLLNKLGADIQTLGDADVFQFDNEEGAEAGRVISTSLGFQIAESIESDPTGRIKKALGGLVDKARALTTLPSFDPNSLLGGPPGTDDAKRDQVDKDAAKAADTAKESLLGLLGSISPVVEAYNTLSDARETLTNKDLEAKLSSEQVAEVMRLVTRDMLGLDDTQRKNAETTRVWQAALNEGAVSAEEFGIKMMEMGLEATEAFDSAFGAVFPLIGATRNLEEASLAAAKHQKELAKAGISAAEAEKRLLREALGLPPTLDQVNESMQVLILNQDKLGLSSDELARSLRKMRIEFLEGQTDMASGLERGALKTLEEFGDTAKLAEELVTNAFKNLEDVLVEFFQTGQLNFKAFIDGITADLTRLAVRDAITGPLAKLLFGSQDPGAQAKKGHIEGGKEAKKLIIEGHVEGMRQAGAAGGAGAALGSALGGNGPGFLDGLDLSIFNDAALDFGLSADELQVWGEQFGSSTAAVLEIGGDTLGSTLSRVFDDGASIFSDIFTGLIGELGGLLGGGGGGGLGSILGLAGSLAGSLGSLFGFAGGGSFGVSKQSAVATLPGVGIDNRVIAFRANDREDVTISQKGESPQGSMSVRMGDIIIQGNADENTVRAIGREQARRASDFSRMAGRNK